MDTNFIAIITLLTIIVKAIIDWRVQGRNRQWQVEDDKRKDEILTQHYRIREELATNTDETLKNRDAIIQATEQATAAYKEANNLNHKMDDSTRLTKEAVESILRRDPKLRSRVTDR